jgi:hypothetical protein
MTSHGLPWLQVLYLAAWESDFYLASEIQGLHISDIDGDFHEKGILFVV